MKLFEKFLAGKFNIFVDIGTKRMSEQQKQKAHTHTHKDNTN